MPPKVERMVGGNSHHSWYIQQARGQACGQANLDRGNNRQKTDKQTDRQTDRQTNRQTNRQVVCQDVPPNVERMVGGNSHHSCNIQLTCIR